MNALDKDDKMRKTKREMIFLKVYARLGDETNEKKV